MRQERAAVLYKHPLLGHGVGRLLKCEFGFEVALIGSLDQHGASLPRDLQLDVIVVEGDDSQATLGLVQQLPPVRVVVVRMQSNVINAYVHRLAVVPPPRDLREALAVTAKTA